MGEVLSQSEIDNLLKALSSGELDVDEMKQANGYLKLVMKPFRQHLMIVRGLMDVKVKFCNH